MFDSAKAFYLDEDEFAENLLHTSASSEIAKPSQQAGQITRNRR